jgi:hypothetical protein
MDSRVSRRRGAFIVIPYCSTVARADVASGSASAATQRLRVRGDEHHLAASSISATVERAGVRGRARHRSIVAEHASTIR